MKDSTKDKISLVMLIGLVASIGTMAIILAEAFNVYREHSTICEDNGFESSPIDDRCVVKSGDIKVHFLIENMERAHRIYRSNNDTF